MSYFQGDKQVPLWHAHQFRLAGRGKSDARATVSGCTGQAASRDLDYFGFCFSAAELMQ
jgi:hypothetical protein